MDWSQIKHFTRREFGEGDPGVEPCHRLVSMLDQARRMAGFPFIVNSGLRTTERNQQVGGSPTSSHLIGHAADLACTDSGRRFIMLSALRRAGFTRIGIGRTFIHCDTDPTKPDSLIWLYD